jgi:hypothetical protein
MMEKMAEPTTTKIKKPRSMGLTGAASSRFYFVYETNGKDEG